MRVIIAGGGTGGLATAIALADQARSAGGPVTFSPVADSVHSFILFDFLPEAGRALEELAEFAHTVRGLVPICRFAETPPSRAAAWRPVCAAGADQAPGRPAVRHRARPASP